MTRHYRFRGMTVACTVATVIAACSESSRERALPTNPNPPVPATPLLTRIALSGPTTVHIGEIAQYTATAHYSDGSSRDVTTEATWFGSNFALELLGNGRYSGRASGFATLSARLLTRSANISSIIVVPPGTYRLSGRVADSGIAVEATILLEDPLGHRTLQTTNGLYSYFGAVGDTRITVARDGYLEQTRRLTIDSHQVVDFALEPSRPRSDLSGRYQLTVTAAAHCTALPSDVRSRSYMTTAEQSGPTLTVRLDTGQYLTQGGRTYNSFTGFVEPTRVVFTLAPSTDPYGYGYFYLPDVFEVLATGTYYAFEGRVNAAIGTTLSANLDGAVGRFSGPPYRSTSRCRSDIHEFLMVKQP